MNHMRCSAYRHAQWLAGLACKTLHIHRLHCHVMPLLIDCSITLVAQRPWGGQVFFVATERTKRYRKHMTKANPHVHRLSWPVVVALQSIEVLKRTETLDAKEKALQAKEAELRRWEADLRATGSLKPKKNWPNRFCPIVHHDIAAEVRSRQLCPLGVTVNATLMLV